MTKYEEKKAARIERLRNRADRSETEATQRFEAAQSIQKMIPFGQPILVGHHSERGHRAHLKKIDNNMRKSVEATKAAEEYSRRADAAENNSAISSDDPQALEKLREKLKTQVEHREVMKRINVAHKKFQKNPESLDASDLPEWAKKIIREYVPRYSWEPHPIAPYQLTNLGANIRSIEKRIEQLESRAALVPTQVEIDGIEIKTNVEENRVQIIFPGKPDDYIRFLLKHCGFRWSPNAGAWQRQISNVANHRAKCIVRYAAFGNKDDLGFQCISREEFQAS